MYFTIKTHICICLLIVKLVHGASVKSHFKKEFGNGDADMVCLVGAAGRDLLGTKVDDFDTCTTFGWEIGSTPNWETGSTYFVKKHVVEIYQTPTELGGTVKLPITFRPGSYIDMYIEFLRDDLSHAINFYDTLDGNMHGILYFCAHYQILIDDQQVAAYKHRVPPQDARKLTFQEGAGLMLHKIEFVGT